MFIDLSYQLHKNKNSTVIIPYIKDNNSFLPFISLSLLGIIYVTLSTIADTVHVPTHILQSNRHSNKFVQVDVLTAYHLFLKDRVVDVLNACNSPYSKKNRVVCDNRELFDVPFVIENKCFS